MHYLPKPRHIGMSSMIISDKDTASKSFWDDAARYAHAVDDDAPFVEEMAYMMVTIHRSGG